MQDALDTAIGLLAEDASLVVRPELDHDTQGVPGSPSVIAAVLRKIDECSVFVGDVTLTFERRVEDQPPAVAESECAGGAWLRTQTPRP